MSRNEDIAWAAGLFEGEGCINMTHKNKGSDRVYVRLMMNTTDRDVIEKFVEIVGYGRVLQPRPSVSPGGGLAKDHHEWIIAKSDEVRRILVMLSPYFGHRRTAKTKDALKILDGIGSMRPRQSRSIHSATSKVVIYR